MNEPKFRTEMRTKERRALFVELIERRDVTVDRAEELSVHVVAKDRGYGLSDELRSKIKLTYERGWVEKTDSGYPHWRLAEFEALIIEWEEALKEQEREIKVLGGVTQMYWLAKELDTYVIGELTKTIAEAMGATTPGSYRAYEFPTPELKQKHETLVQLVREFGVRRFKDGYEKGSTLLMNKLQLKENSVGISTISSRPDSPYTS